MSAIGGIVLQKSFCITEHNFSGPSAQRLNNHASTGQHTSAADAPPHHEGAICD
jgi:hypothetical protein